MNLNLINYFWKNDLAYYVVLGLGHDKFIEADWGGYFAFYIWVLSFSHPYMNLHLINYFWKNDLAYYIVLGLAHDKFIKANWGGYFAFYMSFELLTPPSG